MKVGIVGGMGARAGAHFFQSIIDNSPASGDQDQIEVFLHSNPCIPDRTKAILFNGPSPLPELQRSVDALTSLGADIIAMACITSYYYYPQLIIPADTQFINPFELLESYVYKNLAGSRSAGILASTGALRSQLFHSQLRSIGVNVCEPDGKMQEKFMMSLYGKGGVKTGSISPSARGMFRETVDSLLQSGADFIVGGCSEVPILMHDTSLQVPYVDLIGLMVKDIVDKCYSERSAPVPSRVLSIE
jgi:aspartate racemase